MRSETPKIRSSRIYFTYSIGQPNPSGNTEKDSSYYIVAPEGMTKDRVGE